MKSATAQGAAPGGRTAADRARAPRRRRPAPHRPSSSSVTRRSRSRTRLAARPGAVVRRPGAAARHRPCAAAGGTGAGGTARDARPAVRRRAAAAAARPLERWSKRMQRQGAAATVLTAASPTLTGYGRIVRQDGAHHRHRRAPRRDAGTAGDPRNQQRHLRLRPRSRSSTRFAPSDPPTRRASTTCPIWCGSIASAGWSSRPCRWTTRPRSSASTAAGAGDRGGAPARPQERRADGGRRHARRSGHRPGSNRTSRSAPTRSSTRASTSQGRTAIGARCELHSSVRIVDATLGDEVFVNNFCVIAESRVGSGAKLGPFAHIRPQSDVGEQAHVGNFVELKKTTLGRGSKANHLAYLGDATIGEQRQHRRRHDHLQLRRRRPRTRPSSRTAPSSAATPS